MKKIILILFILCSFAISQIQTTQRQAATGGGAPTIPDTLGNTEIATGTFGSKYDAEGIIITATEDCTTDSIFCYVYAGANGTYQVRLGIYSTTGTSPVVPDALLGSVIFAVPNGFTGWIGRPLEVSLSNGVSYGLGYTTDDSSLDIGMLSGVGLGRITNAGGSGALPDPWNSVQDDDNNYCLFVIYY
jgi:hypothetical protein